MLTVRTRPASRPGSCCGDAVAAMTLPNMMKLWHSWAVWVIAVGWTGEGCRRGRDGWEPSGWERVGCAPEGVCVEHDPCRDLTAVEQPYRVPAGCGRVQQARWGSLWDGIVAWLTVVVWATHCYGESFDVSPCIGSGNL